MPGEGARRQIGLWILTGLLALVYAASGGMKLLGAPQLVENFAKWGYPDWFRIAIGLAEVTGAVLLLVPRVAWLAGAGLSVIMLGAVFTHLRTPGETFIAAVPFVCLILLGVVTYARRPQAG